MNAKRKSRRGVSAIIGGAILFSILFSTGATYFVAVQSSNQLVLTNALDRVKLVRELRDEALGIDGELAANNFMIANVTNQGGSAMRILQMFVIAPNGTLVKHLYTAPLPVTLNQGAFYPINTTIKYDSGTYHFRVITERGSVGTGQYPPPPLVGADQIEAIASDVTTAAIGNLLINFTSLETCVPSSGSCHPTTGAWAAGWKVDKDDELLFRIKVENKGNTTYFLSENTVLTGIGPMGIQSSITAYPFHIKEPPTGGDNNGPPYSPNYGIAIVGESETTIYFGAINAGSDPIQKFPSGGIFMLVLSLFAFEDVNENGTYESGIDTTPYAQTIPFQSVCSREIGVACE